MKFTLRGWPQRQQEMLIVIRGGFSTGDRFEFGSVNQQVINCGINPG